ncbi:MAG: HAMP domain-containing sensor histidine kinase [Pyrinomonadaceae bacterium]
MEFAKFSQDTHKSDDWDDTIVLAACLICMVGIGSFLLVWGSASMADLKFGPMFGTASAVILLAMCVFYHYAYRFFRDSFYHLISIGWAFNAIYLCFETIILPTRRSLEYDLFVFAVGIISSIPFYVATFKPVGDEIQSSEVFIASGAWILALGAWTVGTYLIIENSYAGMIQGGKFAIMTAAGLIFSFYMFVKVGRVASKRLSSEIHKGWATIFPVTFYVYAGLQFLYLLKLWFADSGWMEATFALALIPKMVNSIATLKLIQLSTADVQRQLEQKSVLEDIGALSASIEHDIRNPLEVMQTQFKSMRRRFQASEGMIAAIARLEEQTKRIRATTQIIPILRGEKSYYDTYMAKVNIKDLINRSIRSVKSEMNANSIFFRPTLKDHFVRAYSPMLEQAIVNILRNAVEAIHDYKPKSGQVNINVTAPNDKQVSIDFEDNGGGIPESLLDEVDHLFMTTRGSKKPNSGIGLFITRRILKVHGGRLEINNNNSPGATISMYLPKWVDKN